MKNSLSYNVSKQWYIDDDKIIRFPIFDEFTQICAGMTTRNSFEVTGGLYNGFNTALHVGDDPEFVIENRKKLTNLNGFPFDGYTCANQIHSANISIIDDISVESGRVFANEAIRNCDSLITDRENVLLNIFTADCVPVLIYDCKSGICAAVHAGWKGISLSIVSNTVKTMMMKSGSCADDFIVAIGPCLQTCCYEFGLDYWKRFFLPVLGLSEQALATFSIDGDKIHPDLQVLNKIQLLNCKIPEKNISTVSLCTSCHSDLFFSYRSEKGKTGRMSAFIGRAF